MLLEPDYGKVFPIVIVLGMLLIYAAMVIILYRVRPELGLGPADTLAKPKLRL